PVTSLFLRGREGALQPGGTPCRWRYATRRFRGAGAPARCSRSPPPNRLTDAALPRRRPRRALEAIPRTESPHLALLRAPRRPAPQVPLAGEILVATYNVHR